jgi:hypothetical protein
MTPGQAAKQLGVNRRTTYNWVKKDQENPSDILELNNGKKVGRSSILGAISLFGIVNIQLRQPAIPSKKRRYDKLVPFRGSLFVLFDSQKVNLSLQIQIILFSMTKILIVPKNSMIKRKQYA